MRAREEASTMMPCMLSAESETADGVLRARQSRAGDIECLTHGIDWAAGRLHVWIAGGAGSGDEESGSDESGKIGGTLQVTLLRGRRRDFSLLPCRRCCCGPLAGFVGEEGEDSHTAVERRTWEWLALVPGFGRAGAPHSSASAEASSLKRQGPAPLEQHWTLAVGTGVWRG